MHSFYTEPTNFPYSKKKKSLQNMFIKNSCFQKEKYEKKMKKKIEKKDFVLQENSLENILINREINEARCLE